MWQEKQNKLLKAEIKAILADLSSSVDLYRIVNESLNETMQGLESKRAQSHPWPLLPLIVCEAISGNYEPALPAAAVLQFFKAAAEIFDDIEDADSSTSLAARYGPAVAINAATTLLILAEKAISRLRFRNVENCRIVRIMDSVNSFYTTACIGQHLDIALPPEQLASEDMYLQISDMKSASTFKCACQVGAILANSDSWLIDKFTVFGHNLGMFAQIANDIQGVTQNTDILNRKITLPAVYALTETKGDLHNQLKDAFLQKGQPEINSVGIKDILFGTGAVHYALLKVELFKQQGGDILSEIESKGINVERLRSFLE